MRYKARRGLNGVRVVIIVGCHKKYAKNRDRKAKKEGLRKLIE